MGLFNRQPQSNPEFDRINAMLEQEFGDALDRLQPNHWVGVEGSAVVDIRAEEISDGNCVVSVNSPVLMEIAITPDLCRHLMIECQQSLARWDVWLDENGRTGTILLGAELIDHQGSLDIAEISILVSFLATTADALDDQLMARFGGKRAIDYINQ